MEIKEGSIWRSTEGTTFRVLHVIELEGHTWVHYREEGRNSEREYSCYIESFKQRFTETPK